MYDDALHMDDPCSLGILVEYKVMHAGQGCPVLVNINGFAWAPGMSIEGRFIGLLIASNEWTIKSLLFRESWETNIICMGTTNKSLPVEIPGGS